MHFRHYRQTPIIKLKNCFQSATELSKIGWDGDSEYDQARKCRNNAGGGQYPQLIVQAFNTEDVIGK